MGGNTGKFFIINKGILTNEKIAIESENYAKVKSKGKNHILDSKAKDVINDKKVLVKMVNNHYVNIAENSTGVAPIELDPNSDRDTTEKILKHYEDHPSIIQPKKAAGPNGIPIKVIKTGSKVGSHLTNVINQDIESNKFSEFAKVASV